MIKTPGFPALFIGSLLLVFGCALTPENIQPVRGFNIDRYTGTWYEIARFDHSFEKGLIKVEARYDLRPDGGINVINTGFDPEKNVWKKATGKGYFTGRRDVGQLKVSFFGPFYSGYNVVDIDREYSHVIVCGPNRNYLWILARKPKLEEPVKAALIKKARALGFETDKLIIVHHEDKIESINPGSAKPTTDNL